ncbi:TrmH family RNA methyltransferase [Boudabousia marimammalium]|uniref:rRNA methyltransferase n=1 Tax=Boudabousia marimammalium TaxID=156892 RepID=A0A1Q5PR64_9ACTO|nr:RNA methyltransferase [Boudabousia marimammalium]OKL49925.1 rRNA methyltransferase [Boudabousia marimammalium]
MLVPIVDLDDSRLEIYTQLKDVALRRYAEPDWGIFMAESFNVMERAMTSGCAPVSFLVSPRWLATLRPLLARFLGDDEGGPVPVYVGEEAVLSELTGFHLHRGAIAAMKRPELPSVSELIGNPDVHRVLVLEDLVDHTNVGACFRSAAALGVDAVLITPSCADPLYRRSVRVSMGGVFQVPWTRLPVWPRTQLLTEQGFHTAALALSDDSVSLEEFASSPTVTDRESKIALIMGTEGDGLKPSTVAHSDTVVRIEMSHGVDSLNVAAASAVALWATQRRVAQ